MNSRHHKRWYRNAITASGRVGGTVALLAACLLASGCKSGASLQLPWAQASAEPTAEIAEFSEPAPLPVLTNGPRPEMRRSADGVALASFDAASRARPAMASHTRPGMAPPATAGRMVKVNSASFDEQVLQSDVPVLVDFSATWCGPCKRLEPRLEELAREMPGAKVVQVDIEESPEIAARYDVGRIPSLRVIHRGRVTASHVGLTSKEELKSLLDEPAAAP